MNEISHDTNHFGRSSRHASSGNFGYYKGQGGVAILWNASLSSVTLLFQIQHDRICAIRLQNENGSVFNIFCIYLPARGCADDPRSYARRARGHT